MNTERTGWGLMEWFLIGHEEARLTYASLADKPKQWVLFHSMLQGLLNDDWKSRSVYTNRFHHMGVEQCYEEAAFFHSPPNYIASPLAAAPYGQNTPPEHKPFGRTRSDASTWVCAYCRQSFVEGFLFQDMFQDHVFCSLEHGYAHRTKLMALVPAYQDFLREVTFYPLPTNETKLQYYVSSLPDILSPMVSHTPWNLDVVVPYQAAKKVIHEQETQGTAYDCLETGPGIE